jgi:hypothetical protein
MVFQELEVNLCWLIFRPFVEVEHIAVDLSVMYLMCMMVSILWYPWYSLEWLLCQRWFVIVFWNVRGGNDDLDNCNMSLTRQCPWFPWWPWWRWYPWCPCDGQYDIDTSGVFSRQRRTNQKDGQGEGVTDFPICLSHIWPTVPSRFTHPQELARNTVNVSTRVSSKASFVSKQPKLDPKLVSALFETRRLFWLFRLILKQRVSVFWNNQNIQKTNRNSSKFVKISSFLIPHTISSVCFGCFDTGPKRRNKPKNKFFGFEKKQTKKQPKQIEFRFVSVRTEIKN